MGLFDVFKYRIKPNLYSAAMFLDLISECRNEYACFEFRYQNGPWDKGSYKISCENGPLLLYWRVSHLEDEIAIFNLTLSDTLDKWNHLQRCGYQGYFKIITFGDLYDNICNVLEGYPDKCLEDFHCDYSYQPENPARIIDVFIDFPSDIQLEWKDNYPLLVFYNSASGGGFGSGW